MSRKSMKGTSLMTLEYVRIRCPRCARLVAEAEPHSAVRIKCGRCKGIVQWPEPHSIRDREAGSR